MIDSLPRVNPFRGPRSFQTGDTLYGRDHEARALLATVIAERIVLLHSPSGAGKTSLVQAALVPALEEREFAVLPVIRVGTAPGENGGNRYIRSTLLSLEEGLHPEFQLPADELAGISLAAYLARRIRPDADPVLIFDQFEEVLTRDPTDIAAKHAFFEELGAALRQRRYRALFSMREDFVAALDPYLRHLPTRLGVRFRLDLLGVEGARQALAEPPRQAGVSFPDDLVSRLIDDLRVVNVQRADGSIVQQLGPSVEPVQLQVLGLRLWQRLGPDADAIAPDDLAAVGDVNSALGDYYAEQIAVVAADRGISERSVRAWFDRELITPQGVRGQVLQGAQESAGLDNRAIRALIDAYLVRAEPRRGATWFELAHDRLIAPVRASNAAWEAANLSTLQRQADLWERQGRPAGLLLRDQTLREAEGWAEANPAALTPVDRDFLQLCRDARRQSRRVRNLAIGATALAVAASLAFVAALWFFNRAEEQRRFADQQRLIAEQNARVSRARELAAAAGANLSTDPELSLLLALEAINTTADAGEGPVSEAQESLQRAVQASRVERSFQADNGKALLRAVYSPDGRLLAGGDWLGTVYLWEVATGELRWSSAGHTQHVNGLAFSPDGTALVSGSKDSTITIWEASTGRERLSVPSSSPAEITNLAYSPDGASFATVAVDGLATIYDAATGEEELHIDGHDGTPLYAVAYSPNGAQLATGGDDTTARVWDLAAARAAGSGGAEPLHTLEGHTLTVMGLAFSPDGTRLVSASLDRRAIVWEIAGAAPLVTLDEHTNSLYSAAFSPDGSLIATASSDNTARVWSAASGSTLLTLPGHLNWVNNVVFSPDGNHLVSASYDGTARTWNMGLLPTDSALTLAYSPDGAEIVTVGKAGARFWDAESGVSVARLDYPSPLNSVAFSPDGSWLATAGADGQIQIWDPSDRESARPLRTLVGHEQGISRVIFSPDGTRLASASDDLTVRLWNPQTGEELHVLRGHNNYIYDAAFSPDGRLLASPDLDGQLILWDVVSGAEVDRLVAGSPINTISISPDGAMIAAATTGGAVVVWDLADREERYRVTHQGAANFVAFSPDGRTLASGGDDRLVLLWDAVTGAPRDSIAHLEGVLSLSFAPDSRSLATITVVSRALAVYSFELDVLVARARAEIVRGPTVDECATYRLENGCPAQPD